MNRLFSIVLTLALCFTTTLYQAQAQQQVSGSNGAPAPAGATSVINLSMLLAQQRKGKPRGFSLMAKSRNTVSSGAGLNVITVAAGPNLLVMGSGTVGRLTKWTGFTSGNSFIGDTTIYEDKYGLVGIGTDSPASKLTVNGMIQSLSGGLKFPDGTVQASSATGALLTIAHDTTLAGNGTSSSPLAIQVPLFLSASSTDVFTARQNGGCTGCSAITGFAEGASIGVTGAVTAFVPVPRTGVQGVSDTGIGVLGQSKTDIGVRGEGSLIGVKGGGTGTGVSGQGGSRTNGFGGIGVIAQGGDGGGIGSRGGVGVYALGGLGTGGAIDGLAGFFFGNVQVSGTLSKGAGAFKIDHPLDPENKYLSHSFVESPDMMNIYNGNATTDANGDAVVTLPAYFDVLNKDFRYQLTVIGTFAQAIVAEEVTANRFAIKTSAPNVRVSWQVTGIRHDAFANRNRIQVEEDKTDAERGYYLHPDAFGQPEEKSINWARDPEGILQLRQRRIEAEKMRTQQPNHR
jgi:hypothetical protein